jgi:hypothetical protein
MLPIKREKDEQAPEVAVGSGGVFFLGAAGFKPTNIT